MTISFNAATRELLDGTNFATIATLNPDGSPHTSVIWVKREGDSVLFTTTTARQKGRNLAADPRVSLSIFDAAAPYSYVEIRGTAELIVDEARALSKELSHKYLGEDPPAEPDNVVRLIVRVVPEKITGFSA
jgi:PPOX class probable F420-dependent enzyme